MKDQNSLSAQAEKFKSAIARQPVYSKPIVPPRRDNLGLVNHKADRIKAMAEAAAKEERMLKRKLANEGLGEPPKKTHDVMTAVFEIIRHLRNNRLRKSLDELSSELEMDFEEDNRLLGILKRNPKLIYYPEENKFEFKPDYNVKSSQELFDLVYEQYRNNLNEDPETTIGFEMKALEECVIDPLPFVEELLKEDKIYVLRDKNDQIKTLYFNSYTKPCVIDKEFKDMWSQIKMPSETDLTSEMEKAGLKVMDTFEKKEIVEEKPLSKKPRQSNRKTKVTNTHLQ